MAKLITALTELMTRLTYEDKSTKLAITSLGCVLDLKNREGKGFSVLIMDTNDADVFRKCVLLAAEGI